MKIIFLILMSTILYAVLSLLFAAYFAINNKPKQLKEAITITIFSSMAAAFLLFSIIFALVEV